MHRSHPKFCLFIVLLTCIQFTYAGSIYVDMSDTDEIMLSSDRMEGDDVLEIKAYTELGDSPINTSSNDVQMQLLPFHKEVLVAASTTALEPALIHAVIDAESKHNPRAVSKKGAYGLMQLMPATAKRFGIDKLKQSSHQQNVLVGARYLKELLVTFDGDVELALAAYNAGPASVKKYHDRIPPFRETKLYVPKVLKLYRKYSS